MLSNRNPSAAWMSREYMCRFSREEGFRDSKRLLGFAQTRIAFIEAWAQMSALVPVTLLLLTPDESLWQLQNHHSRLNPEAVLYIFTDIRI
jgi:hypothetical protein